jgi:hypothetical protein
LCPRSVTASRSQAHSVPNSGERGLVEVAAVLPRGGAEPATERPVHGLGRAEPAGARHLLDRGVSALQEPAGCLESLSLDVVGRRGPHFCLEHPAEVPFRQIGLAGELRHGQVIGQPRQQILHRFTVGILRGLQGRELRLTAGSPRTKSSRVLKLLADHSTTPNSSVKTMLTKPITPIPG